MSSVGSPPALYAFLALALAAPACYCGLRARVPASSMAALARDPAWQIVSDVPFVPQQTAHDCGPAALAMVLAHFRVPLRDGERPELAGGDVRAGTLRDVARAQGWRRTSCPGRSTICSRRSSAADRWWSASRSRWR